MKQLFSLLTGLFFCVAIGHAQAKEDKLNLPGDNLNLYAVLKLFQESETLEGFERKLNEENSEINNLDLNNDGKTDYIKVIDNVDGNVHTIVLQVDVSVTEKQDVAVFTVQKDAAGKVQVQLIGDEALYGKNYIVEPNAEDNVGETPNPGYTGNKTTVAGKQVTVEKTTTVVMASWPVVRYIYLPTYSIWNSPWYWNYYPDYWAPWQPLYWHAYWGYHSNWGYWYYGHYRRWPVCRYARWNDFYYQPRRIQSVIVITNRQNGLYRNTYARPQTKQQGIALYNKKNPGGNRLPVVTQPVVERPATKPVKPTMPITERPVTKPIMRPDVQKPVTRPTMPVVKPVTKPMRPAVERPMHPKPVQRDKPADKPEGMGRDRRGR